jgi:hypothetical protein
MLNYFKIFKIKEIMLVGYNTNISYREKTYHIQTEDSGKSNPVIVTLLYSQGAILASKKTNYEHFISAPDFKEKVSKLMKIQHKVMIKELLSGKYTGEVHGEEGEAHTDKTKKEVKAVQEPGTVQKPEEAAANGEEAGKVETTPAAEAPSEEQENRKKQITNSLDDILLNYIMKRVK